MPRPYRMWLYPVPAFVALAGWIFVFATTDVLVIAFGLGLLLLGVVAFGVVVPYASIRATATLPKTFLTEANHELRSPTA